MLQCGVDPKRFPGDAQDIPKNDHREPWGVPAIVFNEIYSNTLQNEFFRVLERDVYPTRILGDSQASEMPMGTPRRLSGDTASSIQRNVF